MARETHASGLAMHEWAAREGLRQSHASSQPIPWLLGRRTPWSDTTPPGWWGWFDHGTRWTRDGRPYCLVGQPYQLHADDLQELLALHTERALDITISTHPAWHCPGGVLSVLVTRGTA